MLCAPRRPWRVDIFIITDVGPDPDDAKALLIAAVLHRHRVISLRGVIANGGGQARERAKLARCLLDHVGARDVPVGVGSRGERVADPRPYEYALAGYDRVDETSLQDGAGLLDDAVNRSRDRGLRLVLISSLRDAADCIDRNPNLFRRKIHTVAIMGGIQRAAPAAQDARGRVGAGGSACAAQTTTQTRTQTQARGGSEASFSGWEPDTAQNNQFDMEAAAAVYRFCFEHGVHVNIVGRHATPYLPMQLARSFADRTNCPVMRYLADAQFRGLAGLWEKLCLGQMPQRCTKEWYFETFCGVDPPTFRARGLQRLGVHDDILAHLNGFVKPYDVVALMTVLPTTRHLFPPYTHVIGGVRHLLCLDRASMVDSAEVTNLLRDTFHEVVLRTCPAPAVLPERKLRRQALAWRKGDAPGVISGGSGGDAERGDGAVGVCGGPCLFGRRPAVAPAPAPVRREGEPMAPTEIVKLLEEAAREASSRVDRLSAGAGLCALAAACVSMVIFSLAWSPVMANVPADVSVTVGDFALYTVGFGVAFTALCASLEPTAAHAVRTRRYALILPIVQLTMLVVVGIGSGLERVVTGIFRGDTANDGFRKAFLPEDEVGIRLGYVRRLFLMLSIVIAYYVAPLVPLVTVIATARTWPRGVRRAVLSLWVHAGITNLASAVFILIYLVLDLHYFGVAEIWFEPPGIVLPVSRWFSPLRVVQVAVMMAFAAAQLTSRGRASVRALVARTFGQAGPVACLAPLFGFGSLRGAREPAQLVREAMFVLAIHRPLTLDAPERAKLFASFATDAYNDCSRPLRGSLRVRAPLPRWLGALGCCWFGGRSALDVDDSAAVAGRTLGDSDMEGGPPAPEADAFVVHGHGDSVRGRAAAIRRWAEAFEAAHGRPPTVLLDPLTRDPSLNLADLVAHVPVYMLRCRRLVVVAGPKLAEQLGTMVLLVVWRAMGGSLEEVDVTLAGEGANEVAQTIASLDTFHVMFLYSRLRLPQSLNGPLRGVVDFATAPRFNRTVREFVGLVIAAAKAGADKEAAAAAEAAEQTQARATFARGGSGFGLGSSDYGGPATSTGSGNQGGDHQHRSTSNAIRRAMAWDFSPGPSQAGPSDVRLVVPGGGGGAAAGAGATAGPSCARGWGLRAWRGSAGGETSSAGGSTTMAMAVRRSWAKSGFGKERRGRSNEGAGSARAESQ